MERNRQTKMIAIIALVVAIARMSLGFAAFSTTLNISSNASVTPNSDSFSILFCDNSQLGYCSLDEAVFIDSDAELVNGASIDGKAPSVYGTMAYDLYASFTRANQSVIYKFYVQNVGEYDAYLRSISYTALDNGTYKKCSATTTDDTKATDSLVQAACEGIKVTVSVGGTTYELGSTNISGHKLSKNSAEEVLFTIEYADGSALADGPFNVEIADIKLDYSTVDGVSNLISFTIDGTTYQAEEGMLWGDWIKSSYNVDGYIATNGTGDECDAIESNNGTPVTCPSMQAYADEFIIAGNSYVTSGMGVSRRC